MASKKQHKQKSKKDVKSILIWNIPTELKDNFRLACFVSERTMRDVIMESMEKFVEATLV